MKVLHTLFFKVIHSRWGKIVLKLGETGSGWLIGKKILDDPSTTEMEGFFTMETWGLLLTFVTALGLDLLQHFQKDGGLRKAQIQNGTEADAWPGPEYNRILDMDGAVRGEAKRKAARKSKFRRFGRKGVRMITFLALLSLCGCSSIMQTDGIDTGKARAAVDEIRSRFEVKAALVPVPQADGRIGMAGPLLILPRKKEPQNLQRSGKQVILDTLEDQASESQEDSEIQDLMKALPSPPEIEEEEAEPEPKFMMAHLPPPPEILDSALNRSILGSSSTTRSKPKMTAR